jgi:nucleotide-binding universal stress UspA family protein
MIERVLVATDGKAPAIGALRTARSLAERDGTAVEVLAVYDLPLQFYAPVTAGMATAGAPPAFGTAAVEALRDQVRTQLEEIGGAARAWPVTVRLGSVAETIARSAAEHEVHAILMGLRPHSAVERWLGRETLLRVVHLSHIPILALPTDARDLPRRAVVAVDLSELSVRAARFAGQLLEPGGTLHIVHTTWAPEPGQNWATLEWARSYRIGVNRQIEELAAALRTESGHDVVVHVREGHDTSHEVIGVADEVGADLIASGSHGHGFLGRLVLGSTAAKLVHGSHGALLIAPPAEVPIELHRGAPADAVVAPVPGPGPGGGG